MMVIFFEGICKKFLMKLELGMYYLKKVKKNIRNRCRAHLSRQLEPMRITRLIGVKLADMVLKKPWSGEGQSPPDFYWHAGQDPGLSWAKRGLTKGKYFHRNNIC